MAVLCEVELVNSIISFFLSFFSSIDVQANNAFDTYRELYFEGGVSSVYLWDLEPSGFAGVVLIKKGESKNRRGRERGNKLVSICANNLYEDRILNNDYVRLSLICVSGKTNF